MTPKPIPQPEEAMTTVTSGASEYLLDADEPERSRLLLQSEIHRPQAEQLSQRLSVPAGGTALDLRCGALGVLDFLSAAVAPAGRGNRHRRRIAHHHPHRQHANRVHLLEPRREAGVPTAGPMPGATTPRDPEIRELYEVRQAADGDGRNDQKQGMNRR
jgi:hypothetical protein